MFFLKGRFKKKLLIQVEMKYIANNIGFAIDEVGPSNVVDLVMDNVDVCK
jgi:hypothetical protein